MANKRPARVRLFAGTKFVRLTVRGIVQRNHTYFGVDGCVVCAVKLEKI